MDSNDRLDVPAIDTFGTWFLGSRTALCVPLLVGVLHYRTFNHKYRCIGQAGQEHGGCCKPRL